MVTGIAIGITALNFAILSYNNFEFELMTRVSEDVDRYGIFFRPISNNSLEIIKLLLQYGADPNKSDNKGRNALHVSAATGKVQIVKLLLSHNAEPRQRDRKNNFPFHYAKDKYTKRVILEALISDEDAKHINGLRSYL